MRDLLMCELLRVRPLFVEIGALPLAPGRHHIHRAAGVYRLGPRQVNALFVHGVCEHGLRLPPMHKHKSPRQELIPRERRVGIATGDEESVALINLGEVHGWWLLSLLQWPPARRHGGLRHIDLARHEQLRYCLSWRERRIHWLKPLFLEKP